MRAIENFFNNAGPQQPANNYTLDSLRHIQLEDLQGLIDQQRYFVLHAPRQTGKTTALYAMMRHYNAGTQYQALYVNIEQAQAAREDVGKAMQSIVSALVDSAKLHLNDDSAQTLWRELVAQSNWGNALTLMLGHLASHDNAQPDSPRPLILLIDGMDALIGDALISVLRQIRAGYADRPHAFPQTVILCGMRDVRDYGMHSSATKEISTGGGVFNIKAASIRLANFDEAELNELYQQHTDATGQVFTQGARALAWRYTQGQPWLVNALAYDVTYEMPEMRDTSHPVTEDIMRQAIQRMVRSRPTCLGQLLAKLQEPRVLSVMAPLLAGTFFANVPKDDLQYCIDLGLLSRGEPGNSNMLRIANDIYREAIALALADMA
jgi:hypothetical protein